MDQGSYWTWMRRKLIEKSHVQAPSTYNNESWEEQAFAQDSAGVLGGCIWPPRSYTCSFCRREFRSAQALGGHMNVHRRDRARLKQSPNPNTCERLPHNPHQSHLKSLGVHPSQVSCLEYKKNHISDPNSIMASPLSSSRVSILSPQENCRERAFVPSVKDDDHQKISLTCDPQMRPNSFCVRVLKVSDSNIEEKNLMAQDISLLDKGEDNIFKNDSSLNLNLVLHRNRSFTESSFDYDDDDDELPSKKQKIDATSLPFFLKPCSVGRHHLQSDVLGLDPSKIEELDLELRLGERPQVK